MQKTKPFSSNITNQFRWDGAAKEAFIAYKMWLLLTEILKTVCASHLSNS